MATKDVEFPRVRFGVSTYEAALSLIAEITSGPPTPWELTIKAGNATWKLDTIHEFYAKLRLDHESSTFGAASDGDDELSLRMYYFASINRTDVAVTHKNIAVIERVMEVFESAAADSVYPPVVVPDPSPPAVFIGHGGGSQEWRELEQYLRNHMGYRTEAYETEPRGGDDIRKILDQMMTRSDFAFLVMSAEDQQPDGTLRGRQNVVHETGLAQGRLGWKRAVVMLENGAEDYSNLAGVQQIRFDKGHISAAFGSVVATLKHELGG
jgi:predicted nucleotide-binding protein